VQQSLNLGPRPSPGTMPLSMGFFFLSFFLLKKNHFIVFPFIIEIRDAHCEMFFNLEMHKTSNENSVIPFLKNNCCIHSFGFFPMYKNTNFK
jgi:hypothetical protein